MNTLLEASFEPTTQSLESIIKQGVRDLEPLRFRWLVWSMLTMVVFITLLVLTIQVYLNCEDEKQPALITGGISLLVVLACRFVTGLYEKGLQTGFDKWRTKAIERVNENAKFSADQYLDSSKFDSSGLNSSCYNRYHGTDLFQLGGLEASNLAINHVYTETYYETDSNGNRIARQRTVVVPIFHGVMLIAEAPLPHPGQVIINDPSHGVNGLRVIQVAHPKFKKQYVCGANDPFVGHRVLTPTLQEALWGYRSRFKLAPRFAYREGLLYIAIPGMTLQTGKRPGRILPVTFARLQTALNQCLKTIEFLSQSYMELSPELD